MRTGLCFVVMALLASGSLLPAQQLIDVTAVHNISGAYGIGNYGGGASFADFNGDGLDDITLPSEQGDSIHLYENTGGSFQHIASPVPEIDESKHVVWVDLDNDGDRDLFVSNRGAPNRVYENAGGLVLTEITPSGLSTAADNSFGVAFGDYDRDGFLDLYVTGYVQYEDVGDAVSVHYETEEPASLNPSSFEPESNLLYHNNGDGTFTELATLAGVAGLPGRSLAAAWTDLNGDGWPDLYVANDVSDNALYLNLGDGTFEDARYGARVADYRGAMGIAVGDWDGDTDQDMFITHWIAQENALFSNMSIERPATGSGDAPLSFIDEADRYGLGQIALDYVGW
ncbi:MAG: VCBS repeat-containing protein, partial [Saprospiraceae bacterium]|nr:VCBS repeat-containing protein [Saprospiraceae bacterium]